MKSMSRPAMDKPAKRLTREWKFRVRVPIGAIFTTTLYVMLIMSYFAQLNLRVLLLFEHLKNLRFLNTRNALNNCYAYWQWRNSIPTRRSELTSKEEQWQTRQESLEKRICELEDSLEKGNKSNSSQRKTPIADIEEITNEMYIHNCSAYIIVSYIVLTTYFINIIKDEIIKASIRLYTHTSILESIL